MSFSALLDLALPRAYVAAVRWLNDRETARDACQEAASRAWAAQASYDPSRAFYPWFYCILRNYCTDLRKQRSRVQLTDDLDVNAEDDTERAYINGEEERRLLAAIATLDPPLREIIELRHFQDLSYREIADILDCPEGTVMSRLYRARRSLREKLTAATPTQATQNDAPRRTS